MEEKVHHSQRCLKDNGKYRKWKKEELEYLREICYGRGYKEIAEMITERFGMECSEIRVRNRMNKEHLKTGIETKFHTKSFSDHLSYFFISSSITDFS